VSKSHIEYDISIPDDSEIVEVASMLRDIGLYADSYQVIEKKREKIQAISEAMGFFNEEKYWIAHEILEYVWKGSTGAERELIGGIILVCAAFVHYQKDEEEICISILRRAFKKLTTTTKRTYYGIDIEVIKNQISDIISENKVEPFKISQC
jgi:predicted metal-dependent hydrolase